MPVSWDEPTQESLHGGVDPKPRGKFGLPFWDETEELGRVGWNYKQGGQVPKYRGGGTIVDYFGSKGVTLGGSNTESLASRLGKK